jgi:hypothetical protein
MFFFFFFIFSCDWVMNSGLCACKADTVTFQPKLQSILLWLFWKWGSHELFAEAGIKL